MSEAPGVIDMREGLRERTTVRIESLLLRLAAFAVILAGTWFIAWQLAHAIAIDGG